MSSSWDALSGLTPGEQAWRAGPDANSITWILWHMLRVEDMWFQFFIQRKSEIWERDGWNEKFGLPTRDNGFGHTSEEVAAFPTLDLAELIGYGDAVRAETLDYLRGVTQEEFERVPREQRPEMSVAAIFPPGHRRGLPAPRPDSLPERPPPLGVGDRLTAESGETTEFFEVS